MKFSELRELKRLTGKISLFLIQKFFKKMKKITIYSTKGRQKYEHTSDATTWGELRSELLEEFDFDNLTATENITRRDLTVDTAILPTEDFNLFLRPKSTKLGILSYKEAKDLIKNADDSVKDYIKDYFGVNYTHLSTANLNIAVDRFIGLRGNPEPTLEPAAPSPETTPMKKLEKVAAKDEYEEEEETVRKNILDLVDIFAITDFYFKASWKDSSSRDCFVELFGEDSVEAFEDDLKRLEDEANEIFG